MNSGLVLDILIICLLTASTGYCFVLNRRLAVLRQGQEEFLTLIDRFDDATKRAETNIGRLRDVSAEVDESLDERITTARRLRDELNFLVERASPLARRPMMPDAPFAATPTDGAGRSVVESGLLDALREARRG